ncbi:serine protease 142 precursor [Nasonia vitripennis]|uniref:Peptidase S1 domain-containing protein n=1 Tax=Nasonia vitripennis TaxID=7425 RepID=A0A7M6UVK6_NASVI|nr:serine protease 142 precursor [Nasonia vitripennis]
MPPRRCLLLVIFGIADFLLIVAADLPIGSVCSLASEGGICRLVDRCQPVYNDLLAGKRPEYVCGFQDGIPIVCCPDGGPPLALTTTLGPIWGTTRPVTTTTRRTTTTTRRSVTTPTRNPLINARPARRMCAEYAKEVYALVEPPVLAGGDQQLVNVSLCAIKSKKLIVGGTKADPKEFPHMASIGYISGSQILWNCGGTLISDRYVLTAAHCTVSTDWGNAEWVRVGDLNLRSNSDDAQPQDRRIAQRIRHPNYRRPAQYNDIALLRLQSPVTFNAYVRPACLSIQPNAPAGTKAVAAGWGVVDWFDEEGSDNLLKVTLPVVSYSTCQQAYANDGNRLPNGINDQTQLCAGQEGKDTCQGDSGGPLVVYSENEECMYDIIGVTSFGKLCGSVAPGVYSRVYAYLAWIESIVWPNLG